MKKSIIELERKKSTETALSSLVLVLRSRTSPNLAFCRISPRSMQPAGTSTCALCHGLRETSQSLKEVTQVFRCECSLEAIILFLFITH